MVGGGSQRGGGAGPDFEGGGTPGWFATPRVCRLTTKAESLGLDEHRAGALLQKRELGLVGGWAALPQMLPAHLFSCNKELKI